MEQYYLAKVENLWVDKFYDAIRKLSLSSKKEDAKKLTIEEVLLIKQLLPITEFFVITVEVKEMLAVIPDEQ